MQVDIEFNSGAQLPMDAIPELARLVEDNGFDCAWGGEAKALPYFFLNYFCVISAAL